MVIPFYNVVMNVGYDRSLASTPPGVSPVARPKDNSVVTNEFLCKLRGSLCP
jgi:hypothetical protein